MDAKRWADDNGGGEVEKRNKEMYKIRFIER